METMQIHKKVSVTNKAEESSFINFVNKNKEPSPKNLQNNRLIFHIDVNSAFLSWEAAHRMQHGERLDLREVPSVVGGDPKSRHGIVLAKSIPAKAYGIKTGETLFSACTKCPNLVVVSPRYDVYLGCSNAMYEVFQRYTPLIQRYSIDECFLDFTNMDKVTQNPIETAYEIKEVIKKELGFTVSVGVSTNKLLAKMGSELRKPDKVNSLFPEEIEEKMWPLPIEELFMVGRATAPKLRKLNIKTIGDLANYDPEILKIRLKSAGIMLWKYANGIEDSKVRKSNHANMKGLGNSTTISFDVTDSRTAHLILMSLTETVAMRLRNAQSCCGCITIFIRNSDFQNYSHQRRLISATDSTNEIVKIANELFDEAWKGEPIRHLGIRVSKLTSNEVRQLSLFDYKNIEKNEALDKAIDSIRFKYGTKAIVRSSFIHSGLKPINGGAGAESYPVMSSLL